MINKRGDSPFQRFDSDHRTTFSIAPPAIKILDRFPGTLDPGRTHLFLYDVWDLPKSLFYKFKRRHMVRLSQLEVLGL